MTEEEAQREVVRYWLGQARHALAPARSEAAAARFSFAVNRAYYACFYAGSAVLLSEGRKFVKHSGVRAASHRHSVKTGRIAPNRGNLTTCSSNLAGKRAMPSWSPLTSRR
jgi:uncharacterized protein (UPF0332 family)